MKKVLVVEDDPNIVELLDIHLNDLECTLEKAYEGKTGLHKALTHKYDLIILDVMLPGMDGMEICRRIRGKEIQTPVMMLTARSEEIDRVLGLEMGADDYLTKPFEDTELLDAIESRLKKREIADTDYKKTFEGINEFITDARAIAKLEDLTNEQKKRSYQRKAEIFRKGDLPNYLFFVMDGKVKEFKTNEDGKELITGIYSSGEFFGYEALLENSEYKESATCIDNSELSLIPKKDFFALIYSNRDVANKFIEMLSNKVTEKEERLLNLAYNSVRQRTADALVTLWDKYGKEPEISISRDDLAHMVGTATESVIRVLSDFKDEKVIEIQSGKIRIAEPEKLKQIVRWNFAR